MLIVVRDILCSVSREDVSTGIDLDTKAGSFYSVFQTLRSIEKSKITDTRKDNLAEKRHLKHETSRQLGSSNFRRVGRPPPEYTQEEIRKASISDPSQPSVGKELFFSSNEAKCQSLGNDVCATILGSIFSEDPPIKWANGRTPLPIVQWDRGSLFQ